MLANEDGYPSKLTGTEIAYELGLDDDAARLHLKYCVDSGLMEYHHLVAASNLKNPHELLPSRVQGLTKGGQDFVRQAEAGDGKWWKQAKEQCAEAGISVTTSTMSQMMSRLISFAIDKVVL